ncbi:hypothetical protein BD408DRAFT_399332 [Parasitella parasitica]|nr:hypothetical protein BD408DRAFT_399332 [Parasitella parasitica]
MDSQQNNKTETSAAIAACAAGSRHATPRQSNSLASGNRSRRSSDMNVDSDTQMSERQEGRPSSVSSISAASREAELDENIERELSDDALPADTRSVMSDSESDLLLDQEMGPLDEEHRRRQFYRDLMVLKDDLYKASHLAMISPDNEAYANRANVLKKHFEIIKSNYNVLFADLLKKAVPPPSLTTGQALIVPTDTPLLQWKKGEIVDNSGMLLSDVA